MSSPTPSPRQFSRGLIEAVAGHDRRVDAALDLHGNSAVASLKLLRMAATTADVVVSPRQFSRGLIEAFGQDQFTAFAGESPRQFSRGLIEAEALADYLEGFDAISTAIQPWPH